MRRLLVWIALITASGCGEQGQPAAPETTKQVTAVSERDRPSEVEMVAWMEAHYSVVILAHDALVQADLESFRSQLALVPEQELPPSTPQAWIPLHDRLQAAAREGADVSDLDAATEALASVVLACGACHAALDSGPIYPAPAPDDGANALQTAMLDHKWASERLWEGVTGPWDNAWQRGADALIVTEAFAELDPQVVLTDDLRRREQQLRELGKEAKATAALDERAMLYARLLATCGECHQQAGVKFQQSK